MFTYFIYPPKPPLNFCYNFFFLIFFPFFFFSFFFFCCENNLDHRSHLRRLREIGQEQDPGTVESMSLLDPSINHESPLVSIPTELEMQSHQQESPSKNPDSPKKKPIKKKSSSLKSHPIAPENEQSSYRNSVLQANTNQSQPIELVHSSIPASDNVASFTSLLDSDLHQPNQSMIMESNSNRNSMLMDSSSNNRSMMLEQGSSFFMMPGTQYSSGLFDNGIAASGFFGNDPNHHGSADGDVGSGIGAYSGCIQGGVPGASVEFVGGVFGGAGGVSNAVGVGGFGSNMGGVMGTSFIPHTNGNTTDEDGHHGFGFSNGPNLFY